jgi:hypothetical protein
MIIQILMRDISAAAGRGSLQPQHSCDQHERDSEHGEWDDVGVSRTHAAERLRDVTRFLPFDEHRL